MATGSSSANDELIRLILSVEGKDQLAELRAAEAAVRDEIETLRQQYEAGSISQEKFLEGGKRLTKSAAELARVIGDVAKAEKPAATGSYELADTYELVAHKSDQVVAHSHPLQAAHRETAAALASITAQAREQSGALGQLDAAMGRAGHAAGRRGNFGMGMLQAGQLIDDAQYGIKGIVNNIPGLVQSLGMGMGVAGVLGIVAVAASQIVTHWDAIKSLWESDATRKEAARMKELAAATEEAKDKLEALQKAKGKDVDEAGAAVDTAVHDVGYKQALADAKAALIRDAAKKGQPIADDADATARAERLLSRSAAGNRPAQKMLGDLFDETFGNAADSGSAFGKALADPGGKKAAFAADLKQKDKEKAEKARRDQEKQEEEDAIEADKMFAKQHEDQEKAAEHKRDKEKQAANAERARQARLRQRADEDAVRQARKEAEIAHKVQQAAPGIDRATAAKVAGLASGLEANNGLSQDQAVLEALGKIVGGMFAVQANQARMATEINAMKALADRARQNNEVVRSQIDRTQPTAPSWLP